jgi:hypothetical protein
MEIPVKGAQMLCEAVVEQAIKDFQVIPNDHSLAEDKDQAEYDRQSAEQFFFGSDSNFVWMAEGLGVDPDTIRSALRERGQVQPVGGIDPRKFPRSSGRNYGSVIDRAARLVA